MKRETTAKKNLAVVENSPLIFVIRGQKIAVGADLAALFGVKAKAFNQAVKQNSMRFPPDFMFELSPEEKKSLVTNCDRFKTLKYSSSCPKAFTKHGILMLPFVLNSPLAIQVSVQLVEIFIQLQKTVVTHGV